jgi:hypothetical protein
MFELTSHAIVRGLNRAVAGERKERRDQNVDGVVHVLPQQARRDDEGACEKSGLKRRSARTASISKVACVFQK